MLLKIALIAFFKAIFVSLYASIAEWREKRRLRSRLP
jgi:hypothetical protein